MQLPGDFIKSIEITDKEAFLASLIEPPIISIRLNPAKINTAYISMDQVPWHPLGRYLPQRPVFTLDPLFHAGTYYVQEASSMLLYQALLQAVNLGRRLKVLDLCAAPGGKSTLLASVMSKDSFLLVNEVIRKRVEPLQHNLTKWGNTNVMISNHDPADFSALSGFFDVVCVDAPCSGEGLFRKDPKAVTEWSLDNVGLCSARQKRILVEAMKLLEEGGVLIYSTCTFNEQENDLNLHWLYQKGGFETVEIDVPKEWGITKTKYGYQCYPQRVKGEGFYLGILRKTSMTKKMFVKNKSTGGLAALSNKDLKLVTPWLSEPDNFTFFQKPNNEIVAVPKVLEDEFSVVATALKRRSSGLEVGMVKQKNFIPTHAFAMSLSISPDLPSVQLDRHQALLYLKKENIEMGKMDSGWHLAQYEGFNLGWVKLLGHRYNNYLPNDWRIRMDIG